MIEGRTETLSETAAETAAIRYADEMRAARAVVRYAAAVADAAHSEAAVRALIRYAVAAADAAHNEAAALALTHYAAAAADEAHSEVAAVRVERPDAESRAVPTNAAFADERAPSCHAGHPFEAVWDADS